jgi:hypothetical protein
MIRYVYSNLSRFLDLGIVWFLLTAIDQHAIDSAVCGSRCELAFWKRYPFSAGGLQAAVFGRRAIGANACAAGGG